MISSTPFSCGSGVGAAPIVLGPKQIPGIDARFTQLSPIGQGGVSEVFACFDEDRKITVALKRMHPDRSNRHDDWTRFLREPKVMSQLDTPSVPRIFDVFPERMYKPYFTMERVRGTDLCWILSELRQESADVKRAFPLPRLVQLICDAAETFSIAHDLGFIHRDIKPENLMITQEGQLKVMDWGLALDLGSPDPESDGRLAKDRRRSQWNRLTNENQLPGTPLYMSPEQISDPKNIDFAADVFSLGAVLYDCLALTTLLKGHTREQIFHYTVLGMYDRPSRNSSRMSIPVDLEDICMRAVQCDRKKRYPSMRDFRNDLNSALADLLQATPL